MGRGSLKSLRPLRPSRLYVGEVRERLKNGRYVVAFPDGYVDRGIPEEWIRRAHPMLGRAFRNTPDPPFVSEPCRPNARQTIHEEGGFIVVDGSCFFETNPSAVPERVRLLLNADAPEIVQSAVAFDDRCRTPWLASLITSRARGEQHLRRLLECLPLRAHVSLKELPCVPAPRASAQRVEARPPRVRTAPDILHWGNLSTTGVTMQ